MVQRSVALFGESSKLLRSAEDGSLLNQIGLNQHHMNIWDSDDDSSVQSQRGSEDENVSDDNVDEEQTSENNQILQGTLASHLELGVGTRLKNSF